MIENMNANELRGQMEIEDFEGTGNREQGTGMAEGYDEAGNLLDYKATGNRQQVTGEPGYDEAGNLINTGMEIGNDLNSSLLTPNSSLT